MSLKRCVSCGVASRDSAERCPACGADFRDARPVTPAGVGRGAEQPKSGLQTAAVAGLLAFAVAGILFLARSNSATGGAKPKPAQQAELGALVAFPGAFFEVTNRDAWDWTDCELEINPKVFGGGFLFRAPRVASGAKLSIGVMQFANGDGDRFNPVAKKASQLSVICQTPRGTASAFFSIR